MICCISEKNHLHYIQKHAIGSSSCASADSGGGRVVRGDRLRNSAGRDGRRIDCACGCRGGADFCRGFSAVRTADGHGVRRRSAARNLQHGGASALRAIFRKLRTGAPAQKLRRYGRVADHRSAHLRIAGDRAAVADPGAGAENPTHRRDAVPRCFWHPLPQTAERVSSASPLRRPVDGAGRFFAGAGALRVPSVLSGTWGRCSFP